jgi:NAD(P)-dependent dehydrogenase (short-subunit alcohol dehydrogenase family)
MLLKDKVAVITGAGRGIGRETAIDFAREGANLVLVSRTISDLEKLVKETEKFGIKSIAVAADVTKTEDVNKIFDITLKKFNKLDILVSNAGIHLRKSIQDTSLEEWENMLKTNLTSTFLCCREAAKIMIAKNYGKIIIVSSESGTKGSACQGAYCTTKFGQLGFMEVLADEVKDYNINVNAVLPSATNTQLLRDSYPEINHSLLIKPGQIATVITFMASEKSSAVKGSAIPVYNAQNLKPNLFNV